MIFEAERLLKYPPLADEIGLVNLRVFWKPMSEGRIGLVSDRNRILGINTVAII